MSHITKVKTKLVDLEMLHLALKDIDCQFEEGDETYFCWDEKACCAGCRF